LNDIKKLKTYEMSHLKQKLLFVRNPKNSPWSWGHWPVWDSPLKQPIVMLYSAKQPNLRQIFKNMSIRYRRKL